MFGTAQILWRKGGSSTASGIFLLIKPIHTCSMESKMEEDELAEVQCDIREAKADLKRAQEWLSQSGHRLNLLLKEEQRLTRAIESNVKEDELAEVQCDIREAKADLKRAQEWLLQSGHRLNLLLEEKQRLTRGTRTEATPRAVAAPPPPPPQVVLPPPPPTVFYYELVLCNVNASLATLSDAGEFRNFVKAKADEIGVTGYIQRYHDNDLKLCFEGTKGQCNEFLDWLVGLKSSYHMIERIQPKLYGERLDMRRYLSFDKIKDHTKLRGNGGTVIKGLHSDKDMEKISAMPVVLE